MRLRGRLRHADEKDDMKDPMLISATYSLVRELIEDAHENYHERTEYVRSLFQQNYWITGVGRSALRFVKLRSVMCRKQQVGGIQPICF